MTVTAIETCDPKCSAFTSARTVKYKRPLARLREARSGRAQSPTPGVGATLRYVRRAWLPRGCCGESVRRVASHGSEVRDRCCERGVGSHNGPNPWNGKPTVRTFHVPLADLAVPQVVRLIPTRHSRPGCNFEYVCVFLWLFLWQIHLKATTVSILPFERFSQQLTLCRYQRNCQTMPLLFLFRVYLALLR